MFGDVAAPVLGPEAPLRVLAPALALVLAVSTPSFDARCVRLRLRLQELLGHLPEPPVLSGQARIVHVLEPIGALSSQVCYVGVGPMDSQLRPSIYANPYSSFLSPGEALISFLEYVFARPDMLDWVRPLVGATCLCDCDLGACCHGVVLMEAAEECARCAGVLRDEPCVPETTLMDAVCDVEELESLRHVTEVEPDMAEEPESVSEADLEAVDKAVLIVRSTPSVAKWKHVDETTRGAAEPLPRTVGWPKSWRHLVTVMRSSNVPVMWEILAGTAGLTMGFAKAGWRVGPPVDFIIEKDFNLLDPRFVALVVGLLLEGRCVYLHLGPHARLSRLRAMGWSVHV